MLTNTKKQKRGERWARQILKSLSDDPEALALVLRLTQLLASRNRRRARLAV